ncbi:hypothetical protein IWQ60_003143 [Tieghemiomyces parasiticus]|uniref:Uncharacterized protein n=1 Tax=Tieghemiomyces parasiticus TaxID=78921 RepID=A0A9W8E0G7_9FUNG|nr:hypothetical protein IWQ60_003143 [Tieghemiomyces parasiticus]
MPKKFRGENSKVAAANDRKAAAQAEKDNKKRAEKEKKEAMEWADGAKKGGKKEAEEAKKAERLAKKKEAAALLAAEEKDLAKSKPIAKSQSLKPAVGAAQKTAQKKTAQIESFQAANRPPVASYAARNINDALDLLSIVNTPDVTPTDPTAADSDLDDSGESTGTRARPVATAATPKLTAGGRQVEIERHPERRHKAALAAYEERELPRLKEENKGLRLNQLKQILWKNWQKSPENPFNQAHLAYNASQGEVAALAHDQRSRLESRLRTD